MKVWIPHERGRELLGTPPPKVTVEVYDGPHAHIPSDPVDVEFWVPTFLATARTVELAGRMRALRVVQLLTAGADAWVGNLDSDVLLCDARGVHDSSTSEWVVTAILSSLRDFPGFARAQARREWTYHVTDELAGKRVLIVGSGSIGEAVARRLDPFEVTVTRVARTARDGVHGVTDLPALLPEADVVVLLLPLTEQTRGMVDADFLSRVRDGALLVNAARGPVTDMAALTRELASGRIAAALDVTDPEPLPTDNPLWTMPNVLLTPHVAGSVRGFPARAYGLVAQQLDRYVRGEPLRNVVQGGY